MELQYKHPFIDGLKVPPPPKYQKDVLKIRTWLSNQPHLPAISDDFIHLFLHACYHSTDKTKTTIEHYFTIRAHNPAIFSDRDPYSAEMQAIINLGYLVRLPKPTPEGYNILLYAVKDPDPSKMVFSDGVKGFCMYNDCILSEDGLAEGYVVIFDMKGVSIGHLARVSLPALRAFMLYIQEAHPCRLKGIHILNTATWIHHIMRIVLPLVKSELLSMVKFHKDNVADGIPRDLMPLEYGGAAPSIEQLDTDTKSMVDKYAGWLRETGVYLRANEEKRLKKSTWWTLFHSNNTNNNNMDEKTFLKNLQID